MGNEDNSYTLCPQIPHQPKKLLNLLLIQRGCRFIKDQYLTIHIYCPRNSDHLLDRDGAAGQLLSRLCRNVQRLQDLIC